MKRRSVLIFGLVVLQALALVVVFAITYLASQDVLLRYAEDLAARIARDTTAYTEDFLDPSEDAAELGASLTESGVLAAGDRSQLTRYFFEVLAARQEVEGIYYGDETGAFTYVSRDGSRAEAAIRVKLVSTTPVRRVRLIWYTETFQSVTAEIDESDTFDPRTRPWYGAAMDQTGLSWTPPYVFFTAQTPGITASIPVVPPGRETAQGVIGVDIGLSALSAFLDGLDISPRGRAAIISEAGDIVAHSDPALVNVTEAGGEMRLTTMEGGQAPLVTQAAGAIDGGLEGLFPGEIRLARFEAEGETWLAAVQRLRLARTPWTVVTTLPEADILAPLYRVRDTALLVTLAVLAATALLGFVFVRKVTRPPS